MTPKKKQPKKSHKPRHGEGSFYFREADQRWVGTIEAGLTAKGTRRRITVTDRDEDRAWDKYQVKRKTLITEGRAAALQKSATVQAWLTTWLEHQAAQLRPNSYNGTASYVRRWIIPTIGRRPLDELAAADIRTVTRTVINAGRSSTTAGTIQGVLQKALRDAIAEGYMVSEAPLLVKKPGKDDSRKRTAIPLERAIPLVQTAVAQDDGSRWVAALLQGMRQGERLGQLWELIDFRQKSITISWQLQELVRDENGRYRIPDGYEVIQLEGRWHLVRPKSSAGERVIPMVPWMEASLLKWREVSTPSPYGLVWPAPGGGLLTDAQDREDWRALQDAAGVWKKPAVDGKPPVYYLGHEARHSTATLLLELGVDPEIIKAIMGHSNIITTAGYQHVSQQMMLAALEAAAERLALPSVPQIEG